MKMQPRRDAHSPDDALARERRPVLPVGAFTPAPPRTAGRDGVLPSSRMAHVSAPTPPGRAARRPGNADLRPVLPVGAGTARERETSADDAAPCQREFPNLSQPRLPRPLNAPPARGRAFFMPGGVYGRTRSWPVLPVGLLPRAPCQPGASSASAFTSRCPKAANSREIARTPITGRRGAGRRTVSSAGTGNPGRRLRRVGLPRASSQIGESRLPATGSVLPSP